MKQRPRWPKSGTGGRTVSRLTRLLVIWVEAIRRFKGRWLAIVVVDAVTA